MYFKKIIIVAVLGIVGLGIMFPGVIGNVFLYYVKGSSLELKQHRIDFALGHWAHFKEGEYTHTISGKKINGKSLKAEIFKIPEEVNIKDILSQCDTSVQKENIQTYLG